MKQMLRNTYLRLSQIWLNILEVLSRRFIAFLLGIVMYLQSWRADREFTPIVLPVTLPEDSNRYSWHER